MDSEHESDAFTALCLLLFRRIIDALCQDALLVNNFDKVHLPTPTEPAGRTPEVVFDYSPPFEWVVDLLQSVLQFRARAQETWELEDASEWLDERAWPVPPVAVNVLMSESETTQGTDREKLFHWLDETKFVVGPEVLIDLHPEVVATHLDLTRIRGNGMELPEYRKRKWDHIGHGFLKKLEQPLCYRDAINDVTEWIEKANDMRLIAIAQGQSQRPLDDRFKEIAGREDEIFQEVSTWWKDNGKRGSVRREVLNVVLKVLVYEPHGQTLTQKQMVAKCKQENPIFGAYAYREQCRALAVLGYRLDDGRMPRKQRSGERISAVIERDTSCET